MYFVVSFGNYKIIQVVPIYLLTSWNNRAIAKFEVYAIYFQHWKYYYNSMVDIKNFVPVAQTKEASGKTFEIFKHNGIIREWKYKSMNNN